MEYVIGKKVTLKRLFTECEVLQFATITGDDNPIHINNQYASETVFKKRVVHGILLTGLFSTIIGTVFPGNGTIYMEQDSHYLAPVYIGEEVTAIVTLTDILKPQKNILKLETIIQKSNGVNAVEGYAIVKAT